ncbi:hypothetical protein CROQUDRAFT_85391 [Cronartium quercuum f. sp. fusiforme G11]|uniref:Uncharacterized protein n=1 Tax=Cronartium quercuum f. sp. fusiforme G11 TaxID=708437 RepID=A0A9P6NVE5_9BASI|nr:hypothetical protein CROQUDRAFT_85391 [Cronartium quercuum f. sp. fusiforme G11]
MWEIGRGAAATSSDETRQAGFTPPKAFPNKRNGVYGQTALRATHSLNTTRFGQRKRKGGGLSGFRTPAKKIADASNGLEKGQAAAIFQLRTGSLSAQCIFCTGSKSRLPSTVEDVAFRKQWHTFFLYCRKYIPNSAVFPHLAQYVVDTSREHAEVDRLQNVVEPPLPSALEICSRRCRSRAPSGPGPGATTV